MATQLQKPATGLKLKATPKKNALTIRVGMKKYVLPIEVRMLSSEKYVFVHVPATAVLMKVAGRALEAVSSDTEAKEAAASFRKSRKKPAARVAKAKTPELPSEIHSILGKIPPNYRLEIGKDGMPRLVRKRNRKPGATAAKPAAKSASKPAAKTAAKPAVRGKKTAKK